MITFDLSQDIEQYDNWFEFLVIAYFCLGVFRSGVSIFVKFRSLVEVGAS